MHRGRLPTANRRSHSGSNRAGSAMSAAPATMWAHHGPLCGGHEEFLRSGCFGHWSDSVLGDLRHLAGPALRFALDREDPATALAVTYALPTGAISGLTSRPAVPGDILVIYIIGPTTDHIQLPPKDASRTSLTIS